MVIAHSKFSLGLPTPQGESRIWERAENGVYACIYMYFRENRSESRREKQKYIFRRIRQAMFKACLNY